MLYKYLVSMPLFYWVHYIAKFKKKNKQNRIETAIASSNTQFIHKYTRYDFHFYMYKFNNIINTS